MNKKMIFAISLSLVATSLVIALVTTKPHFNKLESKFNGYTFVLDSSNSGFLPGSRSSGQSDETNSPRTTNGSQIAFAYGNASKYSNHVGKFATNGYLANYSAFTGLTSVTVTYTTGALSLSTGNSYSNYGTQIEISSGVRYEINNQSHFKLSVTGSMNINIKSVVVEYTCTTPSPLDPVKDHTHHGYHYFAKEPTAEKPGNKEFYTCDECAYVSLVKEDEGEYIDTYLTYELSDTHIAYLAPLYNLHNEYLRKPTQFDYPIAVNLEVPSTGYNADNTGSTNAAGIIQNALDYVGNLGGGTVYISSGQYLLTSQLIIPSRVTLVGDFKGINSSDYGTVFLCDKSYSDGNTIAQNAQIQLASNAGINGVTFYYPHQDVASVTTYGNTIYVNNNSAANLANLFFINSYDGIAINNPTSGGGELANIENVYGTFLHSGISGYSQTDVGYWNNINMSPSYYVNALSEYRCANSSALYKYTRANLIGLILGDLDDYGLNKVNIDNANIGILFPQEAVRPSQGFWGFLNDVHLTDCVTGVYAKNLFYAGSALFTHSSLGQIVNVSSIGMIKLAKCEYDEIVGHGNTVVETGSEDYEAAPSYNDSNSYNIPDYLYYIDTLDDTGATDVSIQLQAELDKVYTGGLFVLKNGTYRLDNPITIPDNTMITSFASSFSRSQTGETKNNLVKFISYSSDSCVKLESGSGINGIRIYNPYKDPETAKAKLDNSQSDSFIAVKGMGNNCFAINTEASFTFTGFDFSSVSGHYIKYCYGTAYQTFIKAGSSGKIIASLSNLNFISRSSLSTFSSVNNTLLDKYTLFEEDSDKLNYVRLLTQTYSTMIELQSSNELVLNCFSYGIKCLINSSGSTLLAINTSLDNLLDGNYMYIINGGDVKIVNTFRVFGKAFNILSGHLEIYGRYDFSNKREMYFNSNTHSSDDPAPLPSYLVSSVLSNCESTSGVSGATRNSSYKHGGSYSWRASSTVSPAIAYTFTSRDISPYMTTGYLRFWLYCANINNKGESATVELTSSGTCDNQEINFAIDNQITKTGWNEIILELSGSRPGPGDEFNASACNYFRFYALNCSCYYYVDDIEFLYDPAALTTITINECESTVGTAGVTLSDFRMDGSYSWKATDNVNPTFVHSFSAINISSYMSDGYLSFYFYCPDVDKLGTYMFVELTSSGLCDHEEITLNVESMVTHDGWNKIKIPLSSMFSGSEEAFDPTRCNYIRIFTLNSDCYFYVDHIQLVK